MVAHGYSNLSFLHSAAETMAMQDRAVRRLDPSGVCAARRLTYPLRPVMDVHLVFRGSDLALLVSAAARGCRRPRA